MSAKVTPVGRIGDSPYRSTHRYRNAQDITTLLYQGDLVDDMWRLDDGDTLAGNAGRRGQGVGMD